MLSLLTAQTGQRAFDVPTVAYCDLVKDAASYDQKIIRVRAVYFGGFESSVFYDGACRGRETWVNFDPAYQKSTEPKILDTYFRIVKASLDENSEGVYPRWWVEILVVGRFEGVKRTHEYEGKTYTSGFGHLDEFDYQLTILSIEDAKAVPKKASK